MRRTGSQIADVTDAEVWVMDPATEYFEQTKALKDTDLLRVRGVPGADYAVRLFKGQPVARTPKGNFSQATVMGIDDATLVGATRNAARRLGTTARAGFRASRSGRLPPALPRRAGRTRSHH